MNILFVCTGNTCRSPMAAALMNKIAMERDLDVRIESAGIFAHEGDNATTEAVLAMRKYGIDLLGHHAQPINEELLQKSDLILTMTAAHKLLFAEAAPDKVYTLAEYAGLDEDIEDPFGGDVEEYEACAEQIYQALLKVADRLEQERGNG
ncbi:MAG TPA: low molecular weight protein arginine phosphatase [Candidatus Avimonoglobus intestinipullorum]|uniref:Low molecular weight protein arginine phosphatase n=1 Tax=Candidatus Avimonoglobus intestinipullorum TaxID=2840699 RepID=A0A9D1LWC5_9FIRM|nr:low molecular weight protein arginine phosphatase [Candidatus Avimonoglobus intestinipullorum]